VDQRVEEREERAVEPPPALLDEVDKLVRHVGTGDCVLWWVKVNKCRE
jgi:hypothetical protein